MGKVCSKPPGSQYPLQTPQNTYKILCLGVGGCGKTTFVKQMKIIHGIKWSDAELDAYLRIIRGNFVNGMQECLQAASSLGKKVLPGNTEHEAHISSLRARTVDLTPELLARLNALWKDPVIQEVMTHHHELLTITHLSYFFDNMDRITQADYKPTDEDILRCRQRTAGASSASIYIDKNYFEFFDIGGQKPERAKWEQILGEHEFTSIIYFIASDEFDVEDEEKEFKRTKMEISRFIFSEIVNSNIVKSDVPIILFLNRRDIFEERIKDPEGYKQFQATFPNFSGGQDVKSGLDFIRDMFTETIRDPENSNPIKAHYTCALDTESLVVVWRSVREYVLKQVLETLGL